MQIKSLILKENRLYKKLKAKDSEEFEGFLKVQFLEDNADFKVGTIVHFNKNLVSYLIPQNEAEG